MRAADSESIDGFAVFIAAAAFRAEFYCVPDVFPTPAPDERTAAEQADFSGKFVFVNFRFSDFSSIFPSMLKNDFSYINEEFRASKVSAQKLDELLAGGWRHFGAQFFRYNLGVHDNEIRLVLPLRIRLDNFTPSKSQQRVLKRNADLQTVFRPIEVTEEKKILFDRHKRRFKTNVPDSLFDFLSDEPSTVPCDGMELCAYETGELLAASFFDVGNRSISGVYAMFAPEEKARSLGIFTMLSIINYVRENQKTFYYPGYAYEGNSFYDYKKRFSGLECYDWRGNWKKFSDEKNEI